MMKSVLDRRKVVVVIIAAVVFSLNSILGSRQWQELGIKSVNKPSFVSEIEERGDGLTNISSGLLDQEHALLSQDERRGGGNSSPSRFYLWQDNITSLLNASYLRPPHTPGAFIHIGKTGGSTLCSIMQNACHSWIPKPCRGKDIRGIHSHISKLTTYFHVPDFTKLEAHQRYHFYVVSTRDPFSRTLSAFTFMHPKNREVVREPRDKGFNKFFDCFDSLESFALALGEKSIGLNDNHTIPIDYPFPPHVTNTSNCEQLARASMDNRVTSAQHFYWDTKGIFKYLPPKFYSTNTTAILVVRNEAMWDDWTTANQFLGQTQVSTFPLTNSRNYSHLVLPVTKKVSDTGRTRLCWSLIPEYKVYLVLLSRADNLTPKQVQESLAIAQKNCPMLELSLPGDPRT